MAFNDTEVRALYLGAMQRSPWTESQVRLQDFASSELHGTTVVVRGASLSGNDAAVLKDDLRVLPPFSMLLSSQHRRDYSSSEPLLVVTALNAETGPYYVFDGAGHEQIVDRLETEAAFVTVFPEERRTASALTTLPPASFTEGIPGPGVTGTVSMLQTSSSGPTLLNSFEYTFCDQVGGGNNEILMKAYFYGEDGTFVGYDQYTASLPPFSDTGHLCDRGPNGYGIEWAEGATMIEHAIPANGAHYVRIEFWEDDCDCFGNDDDFYGSWTWTHGQSNVRKSNQYNQAVWGSCVPGYPGGLQCPYYGQVGVTISWISPSPSQVSALSLHSPQDTLAVTGGPVVLTARFYDQYGYTVVRSVDGWWSTNSSVLQVDNTTGRLTNASGVAPGVEQAYFTAFGLVAGKTLTVVECPPPELICY